MSPDFTCFQRPSSAMKMTPVVSRALSTTAPLNSKPTAPKVNPSPHHAVVRRDLNPLVHSQGTAHIINTLEAEMLSNLPVCADQGVEEALSLSACSGRNQRRRWPPNFKSATRLKFVFLTLAARLPTILLGCASGAAGLRSGHGYQSFLVEVRVCGAGVRSSFMVLSVVLGTEVEHLFHVYSPLIQDIKVCVWCGFVLPISLCLLCVGPSCVTVIIAAPPTLEFACELLLLTYSLLVPESLLQSQIVGTQSLHTNRVAAVPT